jgi:hypothetical protein
MIMGKSVMYFTLHVCWLQNVEAFCFVFVFCFFDFVQLLRIEDEVEAKFVGGGVC